MPINYSSPPRSTNQTNYLQNPRLHQALEKACPGHSGSAITAAISRLVGHPNGYVVIGSVAAHLHAAALSLNNNKNLPPVNNLEIVSTVPFSDPALNGQNDPTHLVKVKPGIYALSGRDVNPPLSIVVRECGANHPNFGKYHESYDHIFGVNVAKLADLRQDHEFRRNDPDAMGKRLSGQALQEGTFDETFPVFASNHSTSSNSPDFSDSEDDAEMVAIGAGDADQFLQLPPAIRRTNLHVPFLGDHAEDEATGQPFLAPNRGRNPFSPPSP